MQQEEWLSRQKAQELATKAWEEGRPTDWFEELYSLAEGDASRVPWADMEPNRHARRLLDSLGSGEGKSALVVGCGLGHDAEDLSLRGYLVTAFDLSPTAIQWARKLHPETTVDYQVADAVMPPIDWQDRFDLIHEIHTLQTLPEDLRKAVCRALVACLAPGGALLVGCRGRNEGPERQTMPIPLPKSTLGFFVDLGLEEQVFEDFMEGEGEGAVRRFQALYVRSSPRQS